MYFELEHAVLLVMQFEPVHKNSAKFLQKACDTEVTKVKCNSQTFPLASPKLFNKMFLWSQAVNMKLLA